MREYLRKFTNYLLEKEPSLVDQVLSSEPLASQELHGFNKAGRLFFAASLWQILGEKEKPENLVVVLPENQQAENFATQLTAFLPEAVVFCFPGPGVIPYDYVQPAADQEMARIRTLARIRQGNPPVVIVTSSEGLLRKMAPASSLREASREIRRGQQVDPDELEKGLAQLGYHRVSMVEAYGQFARKGDIIDVYSPGLENPLRLDFFDIEVDRLRIFDPLTQKSLEELEQSVILPRREFCLNDEERETLLEFFREEQEKRPGLRLPGPEQDLKALRQHLVEERYVPGMEELFPIIYGEAGGASFGDFLGKADKWLWLDPRKILDRAAALRREFEHLHEQRRGDLVTFAPDILLLDHRELRDRMELGWRLEGPRREPDSIEIPFREPPALRGQLSVFREAVDAFVEFQKSGELKKKEDSPQAVWDERLLPPGTEQRLVLTSSLPTQGRRLAGLVPPELVFSRVPEEGSEVRTSQNGQDSEIRTPKKTKIKVKKSKKREIQLKKARKTAQEVATREDSRWHDPERPITVDVSILTEVGFSLPEIGLHLWTDAAIFGRVYRRKKRFKTVESRLIDSFLDLKPGDVVVHINHGIGIFREIKRMEAAGKQRDFLVLEYNKGGILYVPLDQISLVQRYIGKGGNPRLDTLGTNNWKKTKERVSRAIDNLARELVEIYTARQSLQGFAYPVDTGWQESFEAAFEFEETPDQLKAIDEIKNDMESSRPMDRLICGDVGYGKTEVAIRAAFKAVMAGKQVAILAPTTILALQHFNTFKRRFADFPVKIDWISRFRTAKEIRQIRTQMLDGTIDLVVGTHALLRKGTLMKNLGLLIVDEEQRFGVNHKEALKKIRKLVDVLTLTATPIPRTLHMSLIGIRDLSLITTPPANRTKIDTFVMEENDEILKEAMSRELERGGQIYFLHNRVESIEIQAMRVNQLLPQASTAILHGQMPEDEIEQTLLDFQAGRYDILVTTTIIESGIDIPNANTLIVNRADTFGLSQLYQIKGRVGRSSRKAYAYLFYPADRALSEVAGKRLATLQEYQELGSGFKVAMRDLEIRGAGNILGREQSGQIMEVGFELYVQMLEEAVSKLKGEFKPKTRSTINLNTDFYIDDNYIPDPNQKIEFYKRFEQAESTAQLEAISHEMEDRFGRMPESADTFFRLERIRVLASRLGFSKVYPEGKRVALEIAEKVEFDPEKLVKIMEGSSPFSLDPRAPNKLYYQPRQRELRARLSEMEGALHELI